MFKEPKSIFYLVCPLIFMAVLLVVTRSIMEIVINNDWVYLSITVFMLILCVIAVLPVYRKLKQIEVSKHNQNSVGEKK